LLKKAYPLAKNTLKTEADNAVASGQALAFKTALGKYDQIMHMYDAIRRAPGALAVIPSPYNPTEKLRQLRVKAADESYNLGVQMLNRGSREEAKQAYYYFCEVQEWKPGHRDVVRLKDEAFYAANLKVVVDQIPVPTVYSLSANFFQDQIESHLNRKEEGDSFVLFFTPAEADRQGIEADQYLRLAFDDFTVGNSFTEKTIEQVSRDSVKVGTVTIGGEEVDALNTVNATLTTWRKQVVSQGLFSMRIYDAQTNAMLSHEKFPGSFTWESRWGNFQGDERALTEEEKQMCGGSEIPPPPPQQLFIEFTRPIYDRLIPALDRWYAKY